MKRAFQEEIFEAWALKPRPMRVRKVWTSGTKGVGWGTDCFVVGFADLDTDRRCCCWTYWSLWQGVQMYLDAGILEGLRSVWKRGDMGFEVAMVGGIGG